MGMYIRKSIRVGPLRFNLSKSGIGISVGIPGFRIGSGPRGNYVHMGANGLYYRSSIPGGRDIVASENKEKVASNIVTQKPLEIIGSDNVFKMVDTNSESLLSELNSKRRKLSMWPLVAAASSALVCFAILLHVPSWLIILLSPILGTAIFAAYQYDIVSKSVVVLYDMDDVSADIFEKVNRSVIDINTCHSVWHVHSQGDVIDKKYHAGASLIVGRGRVKFSTGQPPNVKTNIDIVSISLSSISLYFLPDRVLVYTNDSFGSIRYADIDLDVSYSLFIEDSYLPADAEVVDYTWEYVNKDGNPDRRFKNNSRIPICNYEMLHFTCPTGLNEMILLSHIGKGLSLKTALQENGLSVESAIERSQSKSV